MRKFCLVSPHLVTTSHNLKVDRMRAAVVCLVAISCIILWNCILYDLPGSHVDECPQGEVDGNGREASHGTVSQIPSEEQRLNVTEWDNLFSKLNKMQGTEEIPRKVLFSGTEKARYPKLELVHITKTGGTTLEKIAIKQAQIRWGRCHYWVGFGCNMKPDLQYGSPRSQRLVNGHGVRAVTWHLPPHWINNNPLLNGNDTFAVVRNPYDRMISEYYCDHYGYKGDDKDDKEVFNQWIVSNLTMSRIQNDHTLPQFYYIFDEEGEKVVTHVLRYERLQSQFPQLMEMYGLNITLPVQEHSNTTRFTKKDLYDDTLGIMNSFYSMDFFFFRYRMITSNKLLPTIRGPAPKSAAKR